MLLAACSPVKMGSAAVVGNQRITSATLDSDVSNLQGAVDAGNQVPADQRAQAVLSWLVRFAIWDKVASDNGIRVNQTQIDSSLAGVAQELEQSAQQSGTSFTSLNGALADNGVPPNLVNALGQWQAQETAFVLKRNGGKTPSTQAAEEKLSTELVQAQCRAANSLHIQVSPQYGKLDYNSSSALYGVSAPTSLLSQPGGAKSPTPAPSFPSC